MGAAPSKPTPSTTRDLDEKAVYLDAARRQAANAEPLGEAMDASLSANTVAAWDKELEDDPTFKLARLVLASSDPIVSLKNRAAEAADEKIFNVNLKGVNDKGDYPGPVTNQASSGRCWLFATTNVLRYNVVETAKLGEFQLSQSYLFFHDKMEKANYYLENMIELVDEPLEGRLVSFLNSAPVGDGGQWDMAYNLVAKYGVIPQTLYPDSFSATSSSRMGWLLTAKLREYAFALRAAARPKEGEAASLQTLRAMKAKYMREIYRTLCTTLGTPPRPDEEFTWEYYDADKKYHSWSGTPREFYAKFCVRKGMDPKDSFSLINDPRNPYEKHYTVKRLGNVLEAGRVKYVNAPIEVLEDAVIAGIKANTPLFYGCDVGKFSNGTKGIMDTAIYDIPTAYGYAYGMDKAQRLVSGESAATHAMVITAVHVGKDGRPVRYKVENSWSNTSGKKGWWMMSAEWFREFVYQVVVPRSIVDKKWAAVLEQKPIEFEPWDPMGALA
ncbi:peptidase C1B, bleomycin hydrolase [Cutaneotrichosporon oleaginosum]|uniref:Cysteine proteinase 1, mitochondrial n=1 Tax=Cutaneotrichosporon oleaginosum TaxID=879819 RepID=A0A0J1B3M2_9TREE|nr:peptidase C1B, bleomycin hydrolase [Cutaneotrichosporon oleaginosum]KLT42249.1 peptidase C1B, bleomycin hydrolase [Cutaneotrichosporon oleaginosum]TXT11422.1 hypothetical protein COLE_01832 [Cutaneotrichosporon oleaginosum]